MASLENPTYTAKLTPKDSDVTFDLGKSGLITELVITDDPDTLAAELDMTIVNATYDGKKMSSWVTPLSKVVVYANTGDGNFRIFSGVVWESEAQTDDTDTIRYTVYDYLIFCMKSEDWFYYKKGMQTKRIMRKICKAWNLKLNYEYGTIKNKRIKPVKNTIGDMMVYVLNQAKSDLSSRYILTIDGSTVVVKYSGTNKTIYCLEKKKNAITSTRRMSMDETITKIKIYGEAKKKSVPKKATLKRNTSDYGTIQEVMDKEKGKKLSKLKKKAKKRLKNKAKPTYTEILSIASNPNIKRGDKVYVNAGSVSGYKVVKCLTLDCLEKRMDLEFY